MQTNGKKALSPLVTGLVLVALFFGFLVLINFGASSYIQRIVIGLCISIILVVSLNLSSGYTGIFSLGHVGFMAIGAYTAAILTLPLSLKVAYLPDLPTWLENTQLSFLPATIIAGFVAMLVALVIGFSIMRLTGPYVSVATLGFLVIVNVILINWDKMTRGARTFSGVPAYTNLWWVGIWTVITIYFVWRIVRSSYGRQMIATRDNFIAAQSIGINVLNMRLLAFCVSAFFTAVAGSLWAHFIQSFSPHAFLFVLTFSVITMLIVGGMGSISGSVIGAVIITVLSEVLRNAERGVNLGFVHLPPVYGASQILMAVIFILLIIYRPEGIMGKRELDFSRIFSFLIPKAKRKEVAPHKIE
jgi:branched-chain amino acid transport system permease protein